MEVNRRAFLQGSALIAGTAMAGGAAVTAVAEEAGDKAIKGNSIAVTEPIGDDQIAEVLEADIVVVGAGNAGSVAAATAVEEGASTILLQKVECVFCHGSGFAAAGTKFQERNDIVAPDPWDVIDDMAREGGSNLAKWEVMKNWAVYGAEVADWIIDKFEATDYGPFMGENPAPASEPWNRTYAVVHLPRGQALNGSRMMALATALVDEALGTGLLDVHYNTPGVQLRQDETGRVTGVIGQREDGSYILCNAAKGVILATGGYEGNPEMYAHYMLHTQGLGTGYSRPDVTTGDGILMATAAGGRIQRFPHCSNIHYDPGIRFPTLKGTTTPWLRVNQLGKRFCNEDANYDSIWAQDIRQPGCLHYQIFDDNYGTDQEFMGTGMTQVKEWNKNMEEALEKGAAFVADTIEELAALIDVPADNLVATVARYNELAEQEEGHEPDFGKLAYKVRKIEKPPFYAIGRQATCLTTLSGVEIDGNFQVLDAEDRPIAGLYAVGNTSGNFFGGLYQRMSMPCMSIGRAIVSGRVAVWRALGLDK